MDCQTIHESKFYREENKIACLQKKNQQMAGVINRIWIKTYGRQWGKDEFWKSCKQQQTRGNIRKYKDQRNLVVKLNIQAKRQSFTSIQSKTMDNDKKFWKTVKPLFSNKNPMSEKITLIEDGRILSNDVGVAECFNEYFCNITDSLAIDPLVTKQMSVEQMVSNFQTRIKDWADDKCTCKICR